MTALVDARPPGFPVALRPGTTLTVTLEWPAGELAGRTFTSTLDGEALGLVVAGDTMTIEATDTQTAAITEPVEWLLLEDIAGTPEPVMIGTWTPSDRPSAVSTSTVQVTQGAALVDVTVNSAQASLVALDTRVAALEGASTLRSWYQASDWDDWTAIPVNTIDNTVSLTASGGVGVLTGVGGPTGDDRRLYLVDGIDVTDVEVYAEFEVTGGAIGAGQTGIAMRAGASQAVIVWNNIFFGVTGPYLLGVWEYNGSTLHGTNQSLTSIDGMRSPILSASGNGTTVTVRCRTPHGLAAGTLIEESFTTGSFVQRTIATTADALTYTFAATPSGSWTAGEWRILIFAGRRRVRARLAGARVSWKQWMPHEAEPAWTDTRRAATALLPATLAHSGGPPPSSGGVGIVAAHMGTGAVVRVSDLDIRRLTGSAS